MRTRLTEATRNAYFLLETLPPLGEAELGLAADELEGHLESIGAGGVLRRLALP
jgi:DNA/RNA-binding domain of Phe-tRNA-synthetase-like protein